MKINNAQILSALLLVFTSAGSWAQDEATVNLGSTVTGNQEQPKVLYIIPWKAPAGPDNLYQTLNSQLEEVFGHVERAELKRELHYRELRTQKTSSVQAVPQK